MERQPVDSSNLKSVGYDEETQTLEIEFSRGDVYQYAGVPRAVYEGLVNSISPGKFFNAAIRGHY